MNSSINNPDKKKKKLKILAIIIAGLIVFRLILPYIVLHYLNQSLANMKGYYGHVNDVNLSLYRGAYVVKEIYINKIDSTSKRETKFFDCRNIDLSVEWHALFNGRIVGELEFDDPSLKFIKDKVEPSQLQKDTTDFRMILEKFMPLEVNRFEVKNGVIHYIDEGSNPKVDIQMDNTYILATNLKSVKDTSLMPALVTASANIYDGNFKFNMQLDPLSKDPVFDMNAELINTSLPKLNEFFKAYAKVDVNKGTLGLYTEIAAKDGAFIGYVKPIIKDIDVLGAEDRKDNFLQQLWEGIVGTTAAILTNPKKDQIATKIPLRGTFKDLKTDGWYAIIVILRNAFIQALQPAIDHEINIASVANPPKDEKKGFFNKLFDKKTPEEKAAKENKNKDK